MNVPSSRKTMRNSVAQTLNRHLRRALAFLIVAASLNLSPLLPGVLAAPGGKTSEATGVIQVAGTVTIDGVPGTSGQTLFSGSQVATSERSESIIDLGKFTRFRLREETDFTLDFSSENISSTLARGTVRGFIPAGIPVSIKTAEGELRTDPRQPSEFLIQVDGETTKVSVKAGQVELRTDDRLQAVSAGEVYTTTSGTQTKPPEEEDGLTDRQKVGLIAAIGATAAVLIILLRGREKEEVPEFGGCPIIPSGETSSICP